MGRLIGIDPGQRRIGVAVGDEETGMAFPRAALRAGARAADGIRALAEAEGTRRVIVGLPFNLDRSEGPQAAAARAFGARLEALGLDVRFSDERLTTWEAAERMTGTGARRPGADAIDSAAAVLILEQYLADRRRRPEES
ncbi:MAG: Holliday junction resolvase RuvX [Candidatus Limnocylindria bacterium]